MGRKKHNTDSKSPAVSASTYILVVFLGTLALALAYRSWPSGRPSLSTSQANQLVDRGLTHVKAGRYEAAIDDFSRSHKHCSASRKPNVAVLLATLHTQAGRHQDALLHYDQLPARAKTETLQVARGYGTSLAATGNDKAALAQFEAACALSGDFECYNMLGCPVHTPRGAAVSYGATGATSGRSVWLKSQANSCCGRCS